MIIKTGQLEEGFVVHTAILIITFTVFIYHEEEYYTSVNVVLLFNVIHVISSSMPGL
jgi:hypothetical protein